MHIPKSVYLSLFALFGLVYGLGFLFPLMDLDATEYAMVAVRMVQRHDYISIISRNMITRQEYDFLDKPHFSFWLEALSYHWFGLNDQAYRLPSLLFTLLATYSTYRLGKRMYNAETGWLAALIFCSAQAIILENHDARMDAILGGAVIFGIWQLMEFIEGKKMLHLALGILGVAMGVATKGMISVVVTGAAIGCWFLYSRQWKRLFDWRWLAAIPLFFLFLSPVLYAYYLQFDLHPEKNIKGLKHVSGVKFLLWTQSFERLAGQGEYVQYPEFSFFFHTYLWAFLPWSLISYSSIFSRAFYFLRTRFSRVPRIEFMTLGAGVGLFLLLSAMQYKMPHYINVLFPLFSILLSSYLIGLFDNKQVRVLNGLTIVQLVVCLILLLLVLVLNLYCFPVHSIPLMILFGLIISAGAFFLIKGENILVKLVVPSAFVVLGVNLLLNGNFYPSLLTFQPGNTMACYVSEQKIDPKAVYYFNTVSRAYDFYTLRTNPVLTKNEVEQLAQSGKRFYLYMDQASLAELPLNGYSVRLLKVAPMFRVTKLSMLFLNPKTRPQALQYTALLRVN